MNHGARKPVRSFAAAFAMMLVLTGSVAVGCSRPGTDNPPAESAERSALRSTGRGFSAAGPWVSFYGNSSQVDVDKMASTFRIINIDVDPDRGNFTRDQISRLKADGRNRVISYLNLGSVEKGRSYWSHAPQGLLPASKITAAHLGPYRGYPDEIWMNPANEDWQRLVVDYIAPRLVAQGIDGFYFDNLEIVEHTDPTHNGPCDAACSQAGLDLVGKLRAKYPDLTFVMQNGTSNRTLNGTTSSGIAFPTLLDGVSHEEVFTKADSRANAEDEHYKVTTDDDAVAELVAWQEHTTGRPNPFWVATEDYVNSCDNVADMRTAYARAEEQKFSAYVSNKSADQNSICYRASR